MRLPRPVRDNLFFLLAESTSQLGSLQVLLDTLSPSVAQRILDRRGYSYNLKMRIHDGCIHKVLNTNSKKELETHSLRAAEAIASELEQMTDLIHDCVRQLSGRKPRRILKSLASAKILDEVIRGVHLTRLGLEKESMKPALKVGEAARRASRKYERFYQNESQNLRKSKHSEDLVAALFVAHRLNEMGSVLLDISEAILSARLGHPLQMGRFQFLKTALEDLGLNDADIDTIAETNSGSGISGISNGRDSGYVAIVKNGQKKKLKEERESVESWHEIFPGLAPQILSYRKQGANASLLIEHLPGFTFEQVLLTGSDKLLSKTIKHLSKKLKDVWRETRRPKKVHAGHMSQLRKRLDSVREIHPDLGRGKGRVCDEPTRSLEQLIDTAETLENRIDPPFSVYIHGDFNLDNIIFDATENRINFIDLHRSRFSDYVQDVAVFMVSNYRLQALDCRTRRRITRVAKKFHTVASKFASRHNDETFEMRLAFGLARSFITSTRFILDHSLAKAIEVLVVSSSRQNHWVVPKGIHDPGKTAQASAAHEALEEAGVIGDVSDNELGTYQYAKWDATCVVTVYPMRVTRELPEHEWEESHRGRKWVPVDTAVEMVHNEQLKRMIARLPSSLAERRS